MSNKKKFEYYDEYGQPVDRYGRAINPKTGRLYEEEGDTAGQEASRRTVRRQPPAPPQHSRSRRGGSKGRKRAPAKRGKRKMSLLKKILLVFALLVALAVGDVCYVLTLYEYDDSNASSLAANTEDGMMNIALFGVDTRENNEESGTRSDAIMIMNVNPANRSVKLVSLMRDSYVDVP